MNIEQAILAHFDVPLANIETWIPAENIHRQNWQEKSEALENHLRDIAGHPDFEISDQEVSILYHRPIAALVSLINARLANDGSRI